MKAGSLLFATYALLAAAQPHALPQHQNVVRATVTRHAQKVVYVDQDGNTLSSSIAHPHASSPTPFTAAAEQARHGHAHHHKKHHPKKHHHKKHHHHHKKSARNHGVSYDPNADNGAYKNVGEITNDFHRIRAAGYHHVRSYHTSWGQVGHMVDACEHTGVKLFPSTDSITNLKGEIHNIIKGVRGRWHLIDTVGVGNELVNSGAASPDQVIQATNEARSMLRAAGYHGPVVAPDVFVQFYNNPELCQASDYIAANCHAFFDGSVSASGAAAFVKQQHLQVKKTCHGKHTRITESGWPSAGDANGAAVPSPENQHTVVEGLKKKFAHRDITLFMAFNEPYRTSDPAQFNAEKFWGIIH